MMRLCLTMDEQWQRRRAENPGSLAVRSADAGRPHRDGDRGRDRRARTARRPARRREGDRAVLGAVRRGRSRAPAFLRHVLGHPDDRRPQPRRPIPAGDDPRRPRLPGHRNARHHRLSRIPGARGHGPDAAPDGGLPQRHRTRSRTRVVRAACSPPPSRRRQSSARRSGFRIPADASSIVVREYVGDSARRRTRDDAHRMPRRRCAAADHRCRGGRAVHRDGVDHRQAGHAAPHHQARTARPSPTCW